MTTTGPNDTKGGDSPPGTRPSRIYPGTLRAIVVWICIIAAIVFIAIAVWGRR